MLYLVSDKQVEKDLKCYPDLHTSFAGERLNNVKEDLFVLEC